MGELSVRNGFSRASGEIRRIAKEKGLDGLCRAIRNYILYHLRDKWRFVYFEFPLDKPLVSFQKKEAAKVKVATPEDIDRIESEIFPNLVADLEYDKRYFRLIGQQGVKCFLAEKNGKLIHYSWLFLNAFESPIMEVPFNKRQLRRGDVFIGPVFTDPTARGIWIYPYVLSCIVRYLQENDCGRRVLLFVDGKNEAARPFYKRLGFKEIDVQPESSFGHVVTMLMNSSKSCLVRRGKRFGLRKEKTT